MRHRHKKDWIIPYVQGKKVLDLGCVCHSLGETESDDWLHKIICSHASSVLGVDYLEEEVNILRERGYNIVCADVQALDLKEKFEVIVAGDLIEHLSNIGNFLQAVRQHLLSGGQFIVTTPNPVHFLRFVILLFTGKVGANAEHTCWFTRKVLDQLVGRYSLKIVEEAFVDDSYQYHHFFSWLGPFLIINYLLCIIRPQFSETLCFVLELD